jgi:hypothetical protein
MLAPKAHGGLELHPVEAMRVWEAVARIDSAAAWNLVMNQAISAYAAWLPPEGAREVFRHGPATTAGRNAAISTPCLRWRSSMPDHVLGNSRFGDLEPELQQLTMNARGAPQWVFLVHPPNELAQLTANSRPAWSAVRFPAPIGPKPRSMPPQDRVRLNDAGQTEQAWPEPSHPYQ